MEPTNKISASASNIALRCVDVVVDHKFPGPLLSKKMKKDDLMLFIKKKSRMCLIDGKDPFRVEAYFFWQIMELFCRRNGKPLMCEVGLLLMKDLRKFRKMASTFKDAVRCKRWVIPLSQLLFSSAPDDEHREAVIKMGDDFASKKLTYPAHICYVVAKMDLGSREQFRLIGCDSLPFGVTVLKEAIIRTETYEYMLSLTSGFAQPSFQIFKLHNICRLPMIGYRDLSLEYCETIAGVIISLPNSFKPSFLQRVITLSCNLLKDLEQEKEPEWLLELRQLHRDKIADTNANRAEQNMPSNSSDLDTPAEKFSILNPHINQEDLYDLQYKTGQLLGQGSFGVVFAGLRKIDGKQVAIKCVNKNRYNMLMRETRDMDAIPMEVILLKKVSEPPRCSNIVNMLDWFDLPHEFLIVLEWPKPCMTLQSFADLQKGCLTEAQTRDVMLQVIRAARHCCERGVLHRDLKASNILINPETMQIKVIDFGCGDLMKDTPFDVYYGTPTLCPPEWIIFREYNGIPATIWGLGILLYHLLTGIYPFRTAQDLESGHLKIPPGLSQDCLDLMLWCLELNSELRPTFEFLLTHDWFTNGNSGQSLGSTANTSNNQPH